MSNAMKIVGVLLLCALAIPGLLGVLGLTVVILVLAVGSLPGILNAATLCANLLLMAALMVPPVLMARQLFRKKDAPASEPVP